MNLSNVGVFFCDTISARKMFWVSNMLKECECICELFHRSMLPSVFIIIKGLRKPWEVIRGKGKLERNANASIAFLQGSKSNPHCVIWFGYSLFLIRNNHIYMISPSFLVSHQNCLAQLCHFMVSYNLYLLTQQFLTSFGICVIFFL